MHLTPHAPEHGAVAGHLHLHAQAGLGSEDFAFIPRLLLAHREPLVRSRVLASPQDQAPLSLETRAARQRAASSTSATRKTRLVFSAATVTVRLSEGRWC